jgi:tetratricopeptide (TPR) repeat protein
MCFILPALSTAPAYAADTLSNEDFPSAVVSSANAHMAAKEYDAAIADFSQIIGQETDAKKICVAAGDVYLARGKAYLSTLRPQIANTDFKHAVQCEPENPVAQFMLGDSYYTLRDSGDAIVAYSDAIKLKPDYVEAYVKRGQNFENLKKFDSSISDYEQALRLDPQNTEALNSRGTVFGTLHRFDDAIADFERADSLRPGDVMVQVNLANAYMWKKDFTKAKEHLEQARNRWNTVRLTARSGDPAITRMDNLIAGYEKRLAKTTE